MHRAAPEPASHAEPAPAGRRAARPFRDPRLEAIARKVDAGIRLDAADGAALFDTADIHGVLRMADAVRRRLHGTTAYYNINRHLNYSNVCALSCSFCAFHRKKDQDGAYEHSLEDIRAEARKARDSGATEMHVVGGLHPWLPFQYYLDMLSAIREEAPALHVKAFTAVEIVHLQRISKRGAAGYEGVKAVLRDLVAAGLGSQIGRAHV